MLLKLKRDVRKKFEYFVIGSRPPQVRELLSNNSLSVGQLNEDKSLALRARDLIFFTTYRQTVNYYSTIQC